MKQSILVASKSEATKALETATREQLIALLSANDPNGIYSDERSIKETGSIATLDELKESFWRSWDGTEPKHIQEFLTLYPAEVLIAQFLSNGTYFNAPDFDTYMETQRAFDINQIEVVEYNDCFDILFYDINEEIIFSTSVNK